jgi:hypothetical protein
MSQFIEGNHKAFTAGATLGRYTRVKISSGVLALAGALDKDVGVVTRPVTVANTPVDVMLRTSNGTTPMVASGAITANSPIFTDANGQVTSTGAGTNNLNLGLALTAASNAGDIIEVLRAGAEG